MMIVAFTAVVASVIAENVIAARAQERARYQDQMQSRLTYFLAQRGR